MGLGVATIIGGGFAHCTPAWDRTWMHETYAKFYMLVEGEAIYENEACREHLVAPRIYFFPPHQASRHTCARTMDVFWMHITIDAPVLELRLRRLRTVRSWSAERWRPWEGVYRQLPQFVSGRTVELELRLQAMMMGFFAELLESEPEDPGSDLPALRQRYEPALRFMDDHFRRNPSLQEVARSVGLSAPHFHRGFTRAFQTTPHRYLLRRRMEIAQQLLTSSQLSVAEVAQAAGYQDPFYFSRVFKRFFRVSPEGFRASRPGQA